MTVVVGTGVLPMPALAAVPDDPLLGRQWYLEQVKAYDAWDAVTGSSEVIVAVLDTGVDLDHPDLAENLWRNPGEIAGDGIDNDRNGYVDDAQGWDFVDHDNVPQPDSSDADDPENIGHGTFVAGVIGAVGNNAEGLSGIAWRVRLMPVRVLGQGGEGVTPDLSAGIRYAVENGASVINVSSSGMAYDPALRAAVNEAYVRGVLVVSALGNASEGGTDLDVKPSYPACYHDSEGADWVLGVAASAKDDTKAAFSNYGAECTDLVAPGVEFAVTAFQNLFVESFQSAYIGWVNGTSMAAPVVSGAAALLKAAEPSLMPSEIMSALQLSVDPLKQPAGTASFGKLGPGRLNVSRALSIVPQIIAARVGTPPPIPESVTALRSTRVVVSASRGYAPRVSVYDGEGNRLTSFLAYAEGFLGGVQVAVGDLDLDGTDEIVTVPGAGGGPHVRVFALDGTLRGQFFAFDAADRHGLALSVADTDRDGRAEIVVRSLAGGPAGFRAFRLDGTRLPDAASFEAPASPLASPLGAFGRSETTLASLVADASGTRVRLTDRAGADLGGFALLPQDRPARSLAVSLP